MPAVSEKQRRAASETEKAYLAGIIDGEGCIGAARYKRQGLGRGRYAMFTVYVAMTDREAVDLLRDIYGGHVREKRDKRDSPRRTCYCWQGYGAIGARLLSDVLPYLRVKARQAELYIEAQTTFVGGPKKGVKGNQPLSEELVARRFSYVDQIQSLNQRREVA